MKKWVLLVVLLTGCGPSLNDMRQVEEASERLIKSNQQLQNVLVAMTAQRDELLRVDQQQMSLLQKQQDEIDEMRRERDAAMQIVKGACGGTGTLFPGAVWDTGTYDFEGKK